MGMTNTASAASASGVRTPPRQGPAHVAAAPGDGHVRPVSDKVAMKVATLVLALEWDRIFGEPDAATHPTVLMGRAAERVFGQPEGDPHKDFATGAFGAAVVPAASALAGAAIMRRLREAGPAAELLGGAFLLKSTFAVRSMNEHAWRVADALARGDPEAARAAVGMTVSRDVSTLDEAGIANTCVGSVSENVTDAAVGPLLAYALFGVPGALAYRAVNTLDAMYGYHGKNEWLGKAAARLDDALNWIPARVAGAGMAVAAAALGMDSAAAAQTMCDEHARTPSPNSGWPIGAAAGALGAEIEKVGYYRLGPPGIDVRREDIARSLMLFNGASLLAAAIAAQVIADTGRRETPNRDTDQPAVRPGGSAQEQPTSSASSSSATERPTGTSSAGRRVGTTSR